MNRRAREHYWIVAAAALLLGLVAPTGTLAWESDGGMICYATGTQVYAEMASDGAGGAFVVWEDLRGGADYDIYVQHVSAEGERSWGYSGLPVCTADQEQGEIRVLADGAGGVFIVWEDGRAGDFDVYAQRVDAAGTMLWGENGLAVSDADGDQLRPVMVPDGFGGVIIAWTDSRNFPLEYSYDVYIQRLDGDGGALWTADGAVVYSEAGTQQFPDLLPDGLGGAYIGWDDTRHDAFDNDISYDVYVGHMPPTGSMGWEQRVIARDFAQNGVRLAPGPEGSIYVFWNHLHSEANGWDVYGSRLGSSGALFFPQDTGRAILGGVETQAIADVVSDGADGAIIFMNDTTGGDHDILAQRVDAALDPLWTPAGVTVSDAAEDQFEVRAIVDGVGGVIAVWHDQRDGVDYDIYAQRLDTGGGALWPVNGLAVCTNEFPQHWPALCTDGANGALFAWKDERHGTPGDIFGHCARGDGSLVPTLLRWSEARWTGEAVRVSWRVFSDGDALGWVVFRAVAPEGTFQPLERTPVLTAEGSWRFDDPDVVAGLSYSYRVELAGGGEPIALFVSDPVTVPGLMTRLMPARPNPFNPATTLDFVLARPGEARLAIYDLAGREIAVLVEEWRGSGEHAVTWHCRDAAGRALPSGAYIARLVTEEQVQAVRLSLVR